MSEVEILKAQVAALEKLVQLKDQVISQLQSYPRYQPWYATNQGVNTGGLFNGQLQQNYQHNANQQTIGLSSLVGGQANG